MDNPYKDLLENMIDVLTAVTASTKRRLTEIEGEDTSCFDPMDDGFLLSLLDHPLVKSGRIKITISNTSADEL